MKTSRFTIRPASFGRLTITDDAGRGEETDAPLATVAEIIEKAGDDWRACEMNERFDADRFAIACNVPRASLDDITGEGKK